MIGISIVVTNNYRDSSNALSQQTDQETSAKDEKWETYTNSKYGYSISFPSSWQAINASANQGLDANDENVLREANMVELKHGQITTSSKEDGHQGFILIQKFDIPKSGTFPTKKVNNVTLKYQAFDNGNIAYYLDLPNNNGYMEFLVNYPKDEKLKSSLEEIMETLTVQ